MLKKCFMLLRKCIMAARLINKKNLIDEIFDGNVFVDVSAKVIAENKGDLSTGELINTIKWDVLFYETKNGKHCKIASFAHQSGTHPNRFHWGLKRFNTDYVPLDMKNITTSHNDCSSFGEVTLYYGQSTCINGICEYDEGYMRFSIHTSTVDCSRNTRRVHPNNRIMNKHQKFIDEMISDEQLSKISEELRAKLFTEEFMRKIKAEILCDVIDMFKMKDQEFGTNEVELLNDYVIDVPHNVQSFPFCVCTAAPLLSPVCIVSDICSVCNKRKI